ncbi:DUF4345 domain-containing protein [Henriciella sp.]|uniref:DUF4345 domain-containing protein n=1 Tax=Henriciella sp. TaxID=1968823 RepID=UPI0026214B1B|nr:DUF4345 domain-containing protein [Henriciella sp.]
MKRAITMTVCAVSGVVITGVGLGLLFWPHSMHAANGIALGGEAGLLSETRAPGGFLLLVGAFILASLVRPGWRYAALVATALVNGGWAAGRLVSAAFDGLPPQALLAAFTIEVTLAGLAVGLLATPAARKEAWS